MSNQLKATAVQVAGQTQPAHTPTNVLIVGVGGQGVIMISKVLATLCQQQNLDVKQSEVHGMSKRGGSVFSHVRFGTSVHSPTIPLGQADVLIALEWAEGLRWLPYLKPDSGTFLADTQQLIPPFACRNRKSGARKAYVKHTAEDIARKIPNCFATDAGRMAADLGNARAANTILLGMLSTALDFPEQEWLTLIAHFVPAKTVDINIQAFALGREWVINHDPGHQEDNAPVIQNFDMEPGLELTHVHALPSINAAWCKSCDICVKFCPERCLSLNEDLKAELSDPEACTSCRICERLCPDFAISIEASTT